MRISDWSSDVCSSDLPPPPRGFAPMKCRASTGFTPTATTPLICRCSDGTGSPSPAAAMPAIILKATDGMPRSPSLCRNKGGRSRLSENDDEGAAPAERSEEHTSELQSLMRISYAVFCLKQKNNYIHRTYHIYTHLF